MNRITESEFKIEVSISRKLHILVEGRRDKLAVERMLIHRDIRTDLVIDAIGERIKSDNGTAESVKSRVIKLCNELQEKGVAGLVDRDFDGFAVTTKVDDDLPERENECNWLNTRGHSIENYVFDKDIIWQAVLQLSIDMRPSDRDLVNKTIEGLINDSCVLSWMAYQHNLLQKLLSAIGKSGQFLFSQNFSLNVPVILHNLESSYSYDALYGFYVANWEPISKSSPNVLRWMIHGHVGMKLIIAALKSLFEVNINEDNFFISCFNYWLDYPETDEMRLLKSFAMA